jgi:hypothetical protein
VSDTTGKILIFLGGLIATLLVVLLVVTISSDDPAPEGASATTTLAAVTTDASATTAAPTTTAGPTTTVPLSTTTSAPSTTTTMPDYLWPEGYGPITAGTDHEVLISSGDLVFDVWDATFASDGYDCGWADGAGDYAGRIRVQLFEFGVGVVIAADNTVRTPEGLGLGSLEAEVRAALGPPTMEFAGYYVPTEWQMFYEYGAVGYRFEFDTRGGPAFSVSAGFYDKIQLGEGCL